MINKNGILRSTLLLRNQRETARVLFETQLIKTAKTRSARLAPIFAHLHFSREPFVGSHYVIDECPGAQY